MNPSYFQELMKTVGINISKSEPRTTSETMDMFTKAGANVVTNEFGTINTAVRDYNWLMGNDSKWDRNPEPKYPPSEPQSRWDKAIGLVEDGLDMVLDNLPLPPFVKDNYEGVRALLRSHAVEPLVNEVYKLLMHVKDNPDELGNLKEDLFNNPYFADASLLAGLIILTGAKVPQAAYPFIGGTVGGTMSGGIKAIMDSLFGGFPDVLTAEQLVEILDEYVDQEVKPSKETIYVSGGGSAPPILSLQQILNKYLNNTKKKKKKKKKKNKSKNGSNQPPDSSKKGGR